MAMCECRLNSTGALGAHTCCESRSAAATKQCACIMRTDTWGGQHRGNSMQVGTYADGRALNYDETTKGFDVGGLPVTPEQVIGYDQAQQMNWLSGELKNWAYLYAANYRAGTATSLPTNAIPESAEDAGTEPSPPKSDTPMSEPQEGQGWFTRQSTPSKVAFVLFYPVSLSYGLWAVWKKGGKFSQLPIWAKALFVLFYPVSIPYGIWAMWKDKRFSQGVRIALTVAASAFVLFAVVRFATWTSANETATTNEPTTTVSEPAKPIPAIVATASVVPDPIPVQSPPPALAPKPKTPTVEEWLRSAVVNKLGAQTNIGDKPKVREVQHQGVKGVYLLSLNGNENLTSKMTKQGLWLDSKDVWQKVFTERSDVSEIIIHWYFPLVDAKGNSSDGIVMSLTMKKKNASNVQWDNVLIENIPVIADAYNESPVLDN